MKILSMTATFGKLEHETITFDQGFNIIEAPNEWGKSTWCAFLTAMLYGIDTRQRTTDSALADKEHYAPWSGAPMTGRMDILWNGKHITLERWTKGRTPFGQFRAYETDTGVELPELTAATCGQTLLGVEKDVFVRSAFLKQTDLPVSDAPALRTRLNALVTTGDESGTAELLSQKLKDLKNRCRHNKTGLLPEAEKERSQLCAKLEQLVGLQSQFAGMKVRLEELEATQRELKNHEANLAYTQSLTYTQKLANAENTLSLATAKCQLLEKECAALPDSTVLQKNLLTLRQLQQEKDALYMRSRMLPPAPTAPVTPELFRGLSPQQAQEKARTCKAEYDALQNKKAKLPVVALCALALIAILLLFVPTFGVFLAIAPVAAGIFLLVQRSRNARKTQEAIQKLLSAFPGISPDRWETIATEYDTSSRSFAQAQNHYEAQRADLAQKLAEADNALQKLMGNQTPGEYTFAVQAALEKHSALAEARREMRSAQEIVQTLEGSHKPVAPPAFADHITYSAPETERMLSDNTIQLHQLQHRLGQLQGQMESLGQQETLSRQLQEVDARIAKLETYHNALNTALSYLEQAKTQLQQRFAPRISQKAQLFMSRLTEGRYNRLYLGSDFSLNAGAQAEDTLHTAQWRSDGTIDQLYLSLRLAVAQELTPQSPLILDDALVRFDDKRLATALKILKEESQDRQVILFTCQSREKAISADL